MHVCAMKISAFASTLMIGLILTNVPADSSMAWAKTIETSSQIGRLNYAGYKQRGHCTVSLIGKHTALTARHCIDSFPIDAAKIVLGYDRGEWEELHTISKAWRHPKKDIALLCLAKPSNITPLRLMDQRLGSKLLQATVQGYRYRRPHLQSTLQCVAQKIGGSIRMECPVEPGMSGSPVSLPNNRIAAVMSRTGAAFSIADSIDGIPVNYCRN